jgi:hypothetical protein
MRDTTICLKTVVWYWELQMSGAERCVCIKRAGQYREMPLPKGSRLVLRLTSVCFEDSGWCKDTQIFT